MHTSPSFEKLMDATGYARRTQQDALVSILSTPRDTPVFVQAGTGVGKSFALLSRAADVGTPGRPAVVASVTNSLLNQYVDKDLPRVAEATGITFVRVLGAKNYVCADSEAGKLAGANELSPRERDIWLYSLCKPSTNPATMGEWRAEGLDSTYACPGSGACKGNQRVWVHEPDCDRICGELCENGYRGDDVHGGCASKRARSRARNVHIVLTNFHFLYFHQYVLETTTESGNPVELLPPWSDLLIDEAHHLPETIRDLRTRVIKEGTGNQIFAFDESVDPPELCEQNRKLIKATKGILTFATEVRKPWGKWDTERPINTVRTAKEVTFLTSYRDKLREFGGAPVTEDVDGEQVQTYGRSTLADLATITELMQGGDTQQRWTALYGEENPHQIQLIPVTAHESFVARMIGTGALVTGTAGDTLPRRCGVYDKAVKVTDVGHPFQYATQVRGWISQYSGVKSNANDSDVVKARLAEVAEFTAGRPSLILCTSHADVRLVAGALSRRTHPAMLLQPREGGSIAANEIAAQYRALVEQGHPAVLIGTSSYATGLDLPGELLTRLVLWSFFGMADHVAQQMTRRYPGFVEEQRHTRVVQSAGRLIRTETDRGEVLVSDCRFWDLLRRVQKYEAVLDKHLLQIPWNKYPRS